MNTRINPRTGNVITTTGIEIGRAYQAPAMPIGSHAERIQAALLNPATDRLWRRLLVWFCGF